MNGFAEMEIFLIQNEHGEFFCKKDYWAGTWVKTTDRARIYRKIGPARATVTFFANKFRERPPPVIVKMSVTATEVINEIERIQKIRDKRQKEREAAELRASKRRLEDAKKDLERAQAKFEAEKQRVDGR